MRGNFRAPTSCFRARSQLKANSEKIEILDNQDDHDKVDNADSLLNTHSEKIINISKKRLYETVFNESGGNDSYSELLSFS